MTANMCISVVWVEQKKKSKKKKKSRPTDPFFSRHVTVNTTFYFLPIILISCTYLKRDTTSKWSYVLISIEGVITLI